MRKKPKRRTAASKIKALEKRCAAIEERLMRLERKTNHL